MRITALSTDRRVDKLINLLVKNATVVVPGPRIASEIGVTRQKVFDWIEKLRSLGIEIHGVHGEGYQLVTVPDILAPSLLRAELGDNPIGCNIVHFFRTDSTNAVALRLAAEGAEHGTVVVAEEQTAGRGRLGRSWYSEKSSGIYASVVLRPPLSPAAAPVLTLMAGLAAQKAVSATTGLAVDIRWPNDLLVNGKKVCGILTEMSAELDRLHAVVLGIGMNVNHNHMPPALEDIATSLRMEVHRGISRVQLLLALLRELERHYQLLLDKGNKAITERWEAASTFAHGKRVRVVSGAGAAQATTTGLDPSGALKIIYDDGRQEALVAGEVVEVK
ncbi:MAG TPA: biotin--[acetyl-CoA-carboxylase] ligase [Terriglobia bacterium]|nr:biotin--[acetyl-CoA-carboxylase] ligase [Terriglobia bacterium]